ncbi:MAG: hypothetical protein ACI4V0_07390, partial [Lachnospiraceae bacterium]
NVLSFQSAIGCPFVGQLIIIGTHVSVAVIPKFETNALLFTRSSPNCCPVTIGLVFHTFLPYASVNMVLP